MTESDNNYKVAKNNWKASEDSKYVFKETVRDLQASKDSADIKILDMVKRLKIKPKNIETTLYVHDTLEKHDTIRLNDSIVDSRLKVVFHTCRHSFASWLVTDGADLFTVRELMGHKSIAMTERYSHLSPDTLRKAVKSMETAIQLKPGADVVQLRK